MSNNPLTPRQGQVFDYIRHYINQNGCPPTVREIAAKFNFSEKAAHSHLVTLENKKYIHRVPGKPRSITIPGMQIKKVPIEGEFMPMSPAAILHGRISVSVIRHLDRHVYQHRLGYVYTAETSFRVGERLLKPAVAFISTARVPADETKGSPVPPDLAIEVISPTDSQWDVSNKVQAYLDAGTRMV